MPSPERHLRGKHPQRRLTGCSDRTTNLVLRRPLDSALHTTIAVMDQFSPRLAALQGRDQGGNAKIGFESVIDQPTIWRVAMSLIAAK